MGRSEVKELAVKKATRERKADRSVFIGDGGVGVRVVFKDGNEASVYIPQALLFEFAGRGLNALVGDIFAKTKSIEAAKEAVGKVFSAVSEGKMPVQEHKPKGVSPIVQAIAYVNGVSREKASAWYASQDRAGKAAARKDSRVKAHLAELEGKEVKAPPVHSFEGLQG